jgi:phosphoribosyl 1,2-cyclic phosphate phosphodiesterase
MEDFIRLGGAHMQFLGTAAADALPGPFCSCKLCEDARQHTRNMRLRSMFLLDEKNLIDCGPDLVAACMKQRLNLSSLENIFITHTHEDHFCASNAGMLSMSKTRPNKSVDVFLSEAAYEKTVKLRETMGSEFSYLDAVTAFDKGLVRLHPVKTQTPFEAGGYRIMAVDTTHRVSEQETAINYLFEKNGQKLIYACDTGFYPAETLRALSGSKVDVLVLEATWGSRTDKSTASHLNCSAFLQMLDTLLDESIIRLDTKIFATHINHKHDLTHDDMQAWFDAHSRFCITVAYDGLKIH